MLISLFGPNSQIKGFPGSSAGKEFTQNAGNLGSIPGLEKSPGEGKGYPLQYSGLENSMDCIVHGVAKSWTRLSDFHFHLQKWTREQVKMCHRYENFSIFNLKRSEERPTTWAPGKMIQLSSPAHPLPTWVEWRIPVDWNLMGTENVDSTWNCWWFLVCFLLNLTFLFRKFC